MQALALDRLTRARSVMERGGTASVDLVAPEISASWTRCLDLGLDPQRAPPLEAIDEAQLRAARERVELARSLALAEMQSLYHQIAGSNFLIAFASPDGVLLDTIADPSFRNAARTASIRPGTLWAEQLRGTNALGTVARTGQAMTVHGGEHFFCHYGALTCTAAPVVGPDGTLAGVLDASSHCGSRQQHTQALVGMAATQIENGLFRQHHRGNLVMAFHSRPEYLHTLSAGLLALDPAGTVLGVNPQARFLLQGLPALPRRHFEDLFRTRFAVLMEGGQAGFHRLEDRVGSVFVADVENLRSLSARLGSMRAPPAAKAERSPAPGEAARFVADDPAVRAALRQVGVGALRRLPILIRGETGTGKEQVARHAHRESRRRGAFVPVNCAALTGSLIEAELFGHAEGAFTGARRGGAPGLVREADGGTLFLDEIGDMPMGLQAVLLRLLDDWSVRPVGGGQLRQVDVLLVAATNARIEEAVEAGCFRADLYYRLNAVTVTLPPLRNRDDLGAIARHILAEVAPGSTLDPNALDHLASLAWPGNIRELRNVLTRLTMDRPGQPVGRDAVAAMLCNAMPHGGAGRGSLRDNVRGRILAAHREAGGNLSETARRLGVSRNTVYRAIAASGSADDHARARIEAG
jgi:transcriptional regulator of acetoin/glycerol metabolism